MQVTPFDDMAQLWLLSKEHCCVQDDLFPNISIFGLPLPASHPQPSFPFFVALVKCYEPSTT